MRRAADRADAHPADAHRSRHRAGAARPGPGARPARLHPYRRLVHRHRPRTAQRAHRSRRGGAGGRGASAGRARACRLRPAQVPQPADGPTPEGAAAGAVQLPRPGQRGAGGAHHRRRPGQPVRRRGQCVARRRTPAGDVHPGRGRPRRAGRALAARPGAHRGRRRDRRADGAGDPAAEGPVLPGPAGRLGRPVRRPELLHLRPPPGHRRPGRGDGVRDRAAPGRGRRIRHRRRRRPGPGARGGPAGRGPYDRPGDGRGGRGVARPGPRHRLRPG